MTRLLPDRSIEGSLPVVAHYDAMLAEAVEKLSDPSPTRRAALYGSIRTRLSSNLRSVRSSTSIESELCTFDEAVNRLEAYINEKAEQEASAEWLSEPVEFKPARSNGRRRNSLALVPLDDTSENGLPNPEEDPTALDSWRSDLLARALQADVPEIQAPPKGRPKRPLRSPTSRQPASAGRLSEGVPRTSPTERGRRRRNWETPDSALRSQDASNRQLALLLPPPMATFPEADPEPTQGWARQRRRRKWLVAVGGVVALFVLAAGVAMTSLSTVSASSVSNAGPAPVAASSLQLPADDTSKPATSRSQPRQISNRGDQRVAGEQSERTLQQFMRWGQKADPAQASR